jgi:hypothetical protein
MKIHKIGKLYSVKNEKNEKVAYEHYATIISHAETTHK